MAVWPFGRRSRRPSEATAGTVEDQPSYPTQSIRQPEALSQPTSQAPVRKPSRGSSLRQRRRTGSSRNNKNHLLAPSQLPPVQPVSPMSSRFGHRPRTPDSQASTEDITALPRSRELQTSPHLRPATRNDADIPYDFRLMSSSSRLGTPTPQLDSVHEKSFPQTGKPRRRLSRSNSGKKRYAADFPRKISKKNRNNPVREEEIRAMSAPSPMPRPPHRGDSGPLRRDSKIIKNGLNRNLERPLSNISIPQPDSGPSSRAGAVEARSYRISMMDMISPRPTIKVSEPYSMVAIGYPSESTRGKNSRKSTAVSQDPQGKRSKRVDDLADEMDSGELRAALERDKRRREMKKERDAERLKRRLERKAEKDRATEEAAENGQAIEGEASSPPRRKHRRRKSSRSSRNEPVDAALEPIESVLDSQQHNTAHTEPAAPSRAPPALPEPPAPTPSAPEPLDSEPVLDFADVDIPESFAPAEGAERQFSQDIHPEEPASEEPSTHVSPLLPPDGDAIPGLPFFNSGSSDLETPVQSPFSSTSFPKHLVHHDDAAPPPTIHLDASNVMHGRYSTFSPPIDQQPTFASSRSVTALPQVPERNVGEVEPEKKRKRRPSFLSFFRRGDKRKSRNRSASEGEDHRHDSGMAFTHTMQDQRVRVGSVSATPQNAPALSSPLSSQVASPVRTASISKFREHLPGLKINYTEPSHLPSPPMSRIHSPVAPKSPISNEHMRGAMITPISHHRISEMSEYEMVPDDEQPRDPSPNRAMNPLTQSLASIDSEGSWLTGKRAKRGMSGLSGTLRNPGSQRNSLSHSESRQSNRNSMDEGNTEAGAMRKVSEEVLHPNNPYMQASNRQLPVAGSKEVTPKPSYYGELAAPDNSFSGERKTYGDVAARKPELKGGIRVKSSEALLKEALAAAVVVDDELRQKDLALHDPDSDDPDTPMSENVQLHHATSVKARRASRDDTKLIEVSRKGSRELLRSPNAEYTQ